MAAMTEHELDRLEAILRSHLHLTLDERGRLFAAARDSIRYREALEKLHDSVTVTDAIAVNTLWVAQQCKNALASK